MMQSSPPSNQQLIEGTLIGALATLPFQWVADTIVNRRIVRATTQINWINQGLAWELSYRILTSTTFPTQHYLYQTCLENLGAEYQTTGYKTIIGGMTGTFVGLAETRLFHPIDTMKVLAQTDPAAFQKSGIRYCYQHYWGSLSAGVGLYMLRSAISNPLSWGGRAWVNHLSENKEINPYLANFLGSFIFSMVRITIGYPFGTIATLMQFNKQAYPSWHAEIKDAIHIGKNLGIQALYTGFHVKGGSQFLASFLRMSLFLGGFNPLPQKPMQDFLHYRTKIFQATPLVNGILGISPNWRKKHEYRR